MKVAILAGGAGTRLSEETKQKPKPMVEIGGKPILCHIMQYYAHYGFTNFVIALGYKGKYIKDYMMNLYRHDGDVTLDFKNGSVETHRGNTLDWHVDLVETGETTSTAGRIRQLSPYLGKETFMLTWGDGVSDVDLDALLKFHRSHGRLATVTAVRPPARYGYMAFNGDRVTEFAEKTQAREGWINGAFFVLEPEIMNYIPNKDTMFEHEPLRELAHDGELMAYKHTSFWQCMDTPREKDLLERLWDNGQAPWKVWN